ncbi:MAG TPA: hypothetical protein VM261_19710 [Kofleriaceae bacterium]|nr:hypothetical protein [Kofleriaceae bacterium]
MRETFLFATIATVISCGPKATPPLVTSTNDPDAGTSSDVGVGAGGGGTGEVVWTWSAGIVAAWRVDGIINDVLALDDKRALAIGGGALHLIALDTGAVTKAATFEKGTPAALVHAGGRVLAWGNHGKVAEAWSIDPATLAVTRLDLPDASVGAGPKGRFAIGVSPDGTRVVTCSDDRWPTVRDATTLAPVQTFSGADGCNSPRFVDDGRVVLDRVDSRTAGRIGDVTTGKLTPVKAGTVLPLPGPGGRSASVEVGKVTISARGKELVTHAAGAFSQPQWLADGSALVSTARGSLVVLPAKAGGVMRTVEMPAAFRRTTPIPGTAKLVFQAGPHRLGVIDAASGAVVTAQGTNLRDVAKIAVIDGTVVSGAERLRVWRGETILAAGPLAVAETIDVDAGKPALYATLDGVFTLDMTSGEAVAVGDGASSTAADRHEDRVLFDADEYVRSRDGGVADDHWFKRKDDFFVTDVDAATGRVAMTDDNAFYVARPDSDELFAFHAFDCQDPLYIYLERGRDRAATYDGVVVHLYDTKTRQALGGIELTDDNIEALAFIPGSHELVLVGESLYLWDPYEQTAVAWPLPAAHGLAGVTTAAVDPTGKQVAVGFSDGSVLWATLDGVRTRAAVVGADVFTSKARPALRCKGKPMVTTLGEVRGPDDDD